jgi:mevalonate kinase
LKLQVFQIKQRRCVLLDSGIVGENPYGHYLHGKPKRQRLPYDAKNQFVKYTDVESFLGGDMKALFMNTKIIKRSFE